MRCEVSDDIRILGEAAIPHLWKDEIGDVFILIKQMEIYVYSKTVLGCYCWSRKTALQLQNSGVIFDVLATDDPLVCFRIDRANLTLILSLGTFKRRPHKNGRWIKSRERLLGHRIKPLNITENELRALIEIAKTAVHTPQNEIPVVAVGLESEYAITE